jgi:hypothetical protein
MGQAFELTGIGVMEQRLREQEYFGVDTDIGLIEEQDRHCAGVHFGGTE